jgi:hypothetical protein
MDHTIRATAGYNPCKKYSDLPLECQANQIPKTAIKAEEMPKTICMVTSSFMVGCCMYEYLRSEGCAKMSAGVV